MGADDTVVRKRVKVTIAVDGGVQWKTGWWGSGAMEEGWAPRKQTEGRQADRTHQPRQHVRVAGWDETAEAAGCVS